MLDTYKGCVPGIIILWLFLKSPEIPPDILGALNIIVRNHFKNAI